MKIVHVINYFQHQLGYQEYFLAKEQVKAGHEVYILTSNKYFPFPDYDRTIKPLVGEREFDSRIEKIDGFKVHRLEGIFEQPARRIWMKGLISTLIKLKPDIILIHGLYHYYSFLIPILYIFKKVMIIMDSHDHYTINSVVSYNLISKFIKLLYKFIWNNFNIKLVAVTNQTKVFMEKEYGIKSNLINVIKLGTDINFFKPNHRLNDEFRKEIGINKNDIIIIYTGKIIESKNPFLILEAVVKINDPKIKILMVGNASEQESEKLDFYKNKLNNNFIHFNSVNNSELLKYYQIADIAIWPKEASMSSVDAMSCELPIIIPDYLTERLEYDNGIGIKENNLEDLIEAIRYLTNNDEIRVQMGKRSRQLAIDKFSWKKINEQFINL